MELICNRTLYSVIATKYLSFETTKCIKKKDKRYPPKEAIITGPYLAEPQSNDEVNQ
jgi:hypothetical protein